MTSAATPTNLFNLNAPARETLAALQGAGDWDAWQGALVLLAGIELGAAAEKAGVEAAEFECATVHDSWLDLVGLETNCPRTAAWLSAWLNRNVDCRDGGGNRMRPYVTTQSTGRLVGGKLIRTKSWVAVHTQYKIGD